MFPRLSIFLDRTSGPTIPATSNIDNKTPPQVIEAVRNYDETIIAYGNSEGRQELREALPAYYAKYGLSVQADDILITTGGSEALQFAFMTLCDPYDEVIIPEPYYTNVSSFAHSAMVTLVPVTSKMEDGFALPDISEFEKRITLLATKKMAAG